MAPPLPPSRWSFRILCQCILLISLVAIGFAPGALADNARQPSQELQDLDKALSRFEADPETSTALAQKLLEAWALRDPVSAITYALSDDHTHAVFLLAAGNVMEAWARRDPVAARLFFEQLGEMPAEFIAPSLLQGYGSQAPESALEWIHTGVPSEKLRVILARSIVGTYETARRTEEIKLWLSLAGVAAAPEGSTAAAELARRLARRKPESAIDFCQSLPVGSPARLAALQETIRQWAKGDPKACREWLSGLRTSGPATIGGFSTQDIDRAIAGFLNGSGSNPAEDSLKLLGAIADPALRASLGSNRTSQP